ncbi:Heat shock 70 kDa protein [Capsicum chinense]|nr:Heat shock 70 kDa protein [Capsicum chinense]
MLLYDGAQNQLLSCVTMREFEISCQLKRLTGSNIAAICEGIRKCIFVLLKQVANIFPQLIMTIEKHCFGGKADTGSKKANVVGMNTSVVPKIDVEFWREHKRDLIGNARALGRSRIACDRAKRTLRSTTQTTTEVDSLFKRIEFYAIITRARFEELWMSMLFKSTEPVGKCLNEAKVDNVQIQEVILVSRSTRIPIIQHLLKDYFDEKKLYASINLNDDTACGTAVLDVILIGNGDENVQELLVVDVTLLDLGVETVGGTIMC